MKEFEFIQKLTSLFGGGAEGIGDDAVLLGDKLIAKDIIVENVHFLPSTPLKYVIKKLFTSNVSDIAAMGGRAECALLGIATPDMSRLDEMSEYIASIANFYGIRLIGGDTSASKSGLFLSLTVIGKRGKNILLRSGAKVGDIIFVSRPLGLSKLSLENELGATHKNINKFAHYEQSAETLLGEFLSNCEGVTAATDISDGLGRDMAHIAEGSARMALIDNDLLRHASVKLVGIDTTHNALLSGEEFALLFCVDAKKATAIENDILTALNRRIYRIGVIIEGKGTFLNNGGTLVDISKYGYEHGQ